MTRHDAIGYAKKPGFIYVLTHPSDPDLYRIGITTQKPKQRLAQHNSDYTKYAGRIVKDTGQKWVLKECHAVPDPYFAEAAFWNATYVVDFPFRRGIEVESMPWKEVQRGLDAAKKAGTRPPPRPPTRLVRNREWMIKQLAGTGLTMIGPYRGLITRVKFRCDRGHEFERSAGVIAYNPLCPMCRLYVCHDDSESTVYSREDLRPIIDSLVANQAGSVMLTPLRESFPMIQAFVSGNFGHLDYWPTDQTTMHVATGVTPEDCPDVVRFHYSREQSADTFEAPKALVIPAEVACAALYEFLSDGKRPTSVHWSEL